MLSPRLRYLAASAAALLLLIAAACGGDDDGGSATPAATDEPTATDGSPASPSAAPTENCDPGNGPPSTGEGPDDLVGQITYVRLVFGCSPDIYIMDATGDNARALTDHPALDDESDLSPDGTKVVFFSNRTGTSLLYTINADGSDLQQLTGQSGGGDVDPRWSPDGERIAFGRGGSVLVMDADGSGVRTVMQSEPGEGGCRTGAIVGGWSPDGERIVYYTANASEHLYWICAVTVESGDVEVLVEEPVGGLHAEPTWSPDGTRIAYRDDREGNFEVFVMDLETGEETNVTNNPALDIEPVWSPDGEWIVFASTRDDPNFDLYIIHPDGSGVQRLLNDPESKDSYPSWR